MRDLAFEQQLKAYKKNLHTITMEILFPRGEKEIDFISRSLAQFVKSKISLNLIIEIYAVAKGLLKFNSPDFPYATYSGILKKYGNEIDRFEVILILSFIRFGCTVDYRKLSDDELKWIYKDAYELVQKFEVIDMNTQGNEMVGAYGRFGYDKTNPIPVYGFLGITEYFGKLRFLDGEKVEYERIGAFSSGNIKELIDGYRISGKNQQQTVLFINIYNNMTSKKAPEEFVLV